ncbi:hypothetical protein [Streptomyces sp. NPDC005181]|uniref:WD40 repeat domain-containing protein n=1 Tax=Streptomyces sp. NPDC005181 TaxID=3156869 RepID=UPI0033B78EF9
MVGSTRPQLRVWRMVGGARLHAEQVHEAALRNPSGSSVALGRGAGELLVSAVDGGAVRLWRLRDGGELPALTGHRSRPTSVSFLPDDTGTVIVADGSRVRVWEPAAARGTGIPDMRRGVPSPGSEHAGAMAITAPGEGAVVLAAGNRAAVWDLAGRHLCDESGLSVISSVDLRAAPDQEIWLAVGGRHSSYGPCLRVRRLADEAAVTLPLDPRQDSTVGAVALATTGGAVRVLAADDRYIRRWDVTTRLPLDGLHVTTGMVEHLAVVETPGAAPFLIATAGDSVWVWEGAEPGTPIRFRLPGGGPARAVAGTHDTTGGRRFAVATSAGVFAGSVEEPVPEGGRRVLYPLTETLGDVRSLAFRTTASGQLVVVAACRSRVVHEWVVDRQPEDRPVTDRGFEVYGVLAAPSEAGLLVAAVGLERMDLLRLDERRV